MKKYLVFQNDGTINENCTNSLSISDYKNENENNYYTYSYKNENYVVFIENNHTQNMSKIPFLEPCTGIIILFKVENFDNLKIKSFTENMYIKVLNIHTEYIDYSSDDFNPDTCDKLKNC